MLKGLALFFVASAMLLVCAAGAGIMTPNTTPITLPSNVTANQYGSLYDIYVESNNSIGFLLCNSAFLQWNITNNSIVGQYGITLEWGYTRIHWELAQSGWLFLETGSSLIRFSKYDITQYTVLNHISNASAGFDSARKLGFIVPYYEDTETLIYNLTSMTLISSFSYLQGGPFPSWHSEYPGAWAVTVDPTRSLLWLGVDCSSPTPAVVWQFDYTNLHNPVLRNWAIFGANQCFEEGFVNTVDGKLWMYEDDAGWAGGFRLEDMNFGAPWTVQTGALYVEALEYDSATNTGFFVTGGTSSWGVPGQIFRVCLLEEGPSATHEYVSWAPSSDTSNIMGTYWDASNSSLYLVDNYGSVGNIYVTTVGTTDCSQTSSDDIAILPFSTPGGGRQIMQAGPEPLPLPALDSQVTDVYVEGDNQLFYVLTNYYLYQLSWNTPHTVLQNISVPSYGGIRSELARSDRWLFFYSSSSVWRVDMLNFNDYQESSFSIGSDVNMVIESARKLGVLISYDHSNLYWMALSNLTMIESFIYAQGGATPTSGGDLGAWALAVDPLRSLLYLASSCSGLNPSQVWQFDYSANLSDPVLKNWIIVGADQCFEEAFVNAADGAVWMCEVDAGWAGGFDAQNLNWGKAWTVPSGLYVENMEYDYASRTGFFIATNDNAEQSQVFRTCLMETGMGATHEWLTLPIYLSEESGTFWDPSNKVLYLVNTQTGDVYYVTVGSSDCEGASSASQLESPLSLLTSALL